jgi:photosystem II stability/assembly factor-like uncharacterized protein
MEWEELKPPHGDNHDMWINPENPQLFIQANDGGANVTHNGGKTWSTQFNQATTELYQVEVDDQYPYWLYAGQQDNSTTIAVPSRAPYGVQHTARWLIEAGGCETGPAVPKPGDHNTVYANCKGRFGVYDKRTGQERRYYVGAANMYGHNPRDLRYRFQRVSPIHVSPHDPDTVYHASQFVHRTRDEGETWETISPDLTAFEADKQVISGSPITRDITGEEFYSTIYSLRESPVQAGVIWVGANDGPIHVTRDGGESWSDVTPRGLPAGGRVDSVEPSSHDAAVAYVSVLRYQLGDDRPYIYRTQNFGKSWKLLSDGRNGIPADYPVRVVREDPVRRGLLFAGTEYGLFVSFDDGQRWQSFQQNLPVTPVTDIRIHRGDLAISTMGRAFWVLDSVATLREATLPAAGDKPLLFAPAEAIRYRQSYGSTDAQAVPQYPKPSAIIDYYLPDEGSDVTLDIVAADGTVVNAYRSSGDDTHAEAETEAEEDMVLSETRYIDSASLDFAGGINRFHWDMRHRGAWDDDKKKRFDDGPLVKPGEYTLRLSVDGDTLEQTLRIRTDPRVTEAGISDSDIGAQVDLHLQVVALLDEARRLAAALEAGKPAESEHSASRAAAVEEALVALETAEGTYQQPMLIAQIAYLSSMLRQADQRPGRDAYERYELLRQQFVALREALDIAGG